MNNQQEENNQQQQSVEKQTEQQSQEQGSEVTFTDDQQEAINKMIAEKVAKERAKAEAEAQKKQQQVEKDKQDAVKKAEERAKMSADERAKAEQKDREEALTKKMAELERQTHELQTKNMLLDKGISTDLLPLVMGANDDETSQRLDLLNQYVDKKIQEATEKLMAGKKAPSAGNSGSSVVATGDNPWSKQGWNLTKQQQLLTTNPEEAQQMIAQANPQGFYIGRN